MDQIDQYSQWSSSSKEKQHNIYATLNQNLQRYQLKQKNQLRKLKSFRINRYVCNDRVIPSQRHIKLLKAQNKENQNLQNCYLSLEMERNFINKSKQRVQQQYQNIRVLRSGCQNREGMKPLQLRELKFQHKNRKKAKDKWVEILSQLKGGKKNISLKQIDNINKQSKEEKIDLFFKLLKK